MKKVNKVTIRITEQQLRMIVDNTIDNKQTKSSYIRQILDEKLDQNCRKDVLS